jgi:hypothetical protein
MQRSAGQDDHLACFPRDQASQSTRRSSPAPRHRIGVERLPEQAGSNSSGVGITATRAVRLCAPGSVAGNGIFGLKTERQNPLPKVANAGRDKNPELGWQKSPAETAYLTSSRKFAVCEGWVVETVGLKLVTTQSSNRSPPAPGTEISNAETGLQKSALHLAETDLETLRKRESPHFRGPTGRLARTIRFAKGGWWRMQSSETGLQSGNREFSKITGRNGLSES